MKMLNHPNVVTLYNSFYSQTETVSFVVNSYDLGRGISPLGHGVYTRESLPL